MSPLEATTRLNGVLAHLWMLRTFLKHADEVTEDEQLIEVPRLLYDSIRAVEPAFLKQDYTTYLRRLKGKLPKLKKCAAMFASEYKRVSAHTNFEMAAASLTECVTRIEEILGSLGATPLEPLDDQPTEVA